jgi:hypothetical protein
MPPYPVAWLIRKYEGIFIHKLLCIKIHHVLALSHPARPNVAGNTIFVDKRSWANVPCVFRSGRFERPDGKHLRCRLLNVPDRGTFLLQGCY